MLPAKRLLLWHNLKKAIRSAQEELGRDEATLSALRRQVSRLEEKRDNLPAPENNDDEIAKMLLEQELWLANKACREHQIKSENVKQMIREQQFDLLQMEQELDEVFFSAYVKLEESSEMPIAEVRNKCCMGCHRALSMRKLDEWRRGKGPVFCDECDRILV